ncbi:hypothetical protein [Streptomyces sp. KL116D]|uniref:hypothetical protein n=1 Tax=Streptomyces sp. KL116D TaxID=3045152 RepID=UPI003557C8B4
MHAIDAETGKLRWTFNDGSGDYHQWLVATDGKYVFAPARQEAARAACLSVLTAVSDEHSRCRLFVSNPSWSRSCGSVRPFAAPGPLPGGVRHQGRHQRVGRLPAGIERPNDWPALWLSSRSVAAVCARQGGPRSHVVDDLTTSCPRCPSEGGCCRVRLYRPFLASARPAGQHSYPSFLRSRFCAAVSAAIATAASAKQPQTKVTDREPVSRCGEQRDGEPASGSACALIRRRQATCWG